MTSVRLLAVDGSDAIDSDAFAALLDMATPSRRSRVERYLRPADAARGLVAEALLRLGHKIHCREFDPSRLQFNSFGKPFLPESSLHFNLAHSGQWVVCGFHEDEIGTDVEQHVPRDAGIADRFFSPLEKERLATASGPDALRLFHRMWAAKESYIKAIGLGLSCPLDSFTCLPAIQGTSVEFHRSKSDLRARRIFLPDLHPEYTCAVCVTSEVTIPIPSILSVPDLVSSLSE